MFDFKDTIHPGRNCLETAGGNIVGTVLRNSSGKTITVKNYLFQDVRFNVEDIIFEDCVFEEKTVTINIGPIIPAGPITFGALGSFGQAIKSIYSLNNKSYDYLTNCKFIRCKFIGLEISDSTLTNTTFTHCEYIDCECPPQFIEGFEV